MARLFLTSLLTGKELPDGCQLATPGLCAMHTKIDESDMVFVDTAGKNKSIPMGDEEEFDNAIHEEYFQRGLVSELCPNVLMVVGKMTRAEQKNLRELCSQMKNSATNRKEGVGAIIFIVHNWRDVSTQAGFNDNLEEICSLFNAGGTNEAGAHSVLTTPGIKIKREGKVGKIVKADGSFVHIQWEDTDHGKINQVTPFTQDEWRKLVDNRLIEQADKKKATFERMVKAVRFAKSGRNRPDCNDDEDSLEEDDSDGKDPNGTQISPDTLPKVPDSVDTHSCASEVSGVREPASAGGAGWAPWTSLTSNKKKRLRRRVGKREVTMISGFMDGVEQRHFFLAKHSGDLKNDINLPTIELLKNSLVHGTVRTTGSEKNTGQFNYVQQFCEAVEKVAPKFFKVPGQPAQPVRLTVTKPRICLATNNKSSKAKDAKAGSNTQEADSKRLEAKSLALAIAPEQFYDVVMRAALDKDFRDFNQQGIECRVQSKHLHEDVQKQPWANATFRLRLSPSAAKFTPNVHHAEAEVLPPVLPAGVPLHSICINGMSCPYKVFQHVGAENDAGTCMRKKWQIDVPGFGHVNNLNEEVPRLRLRDIKAAGGMGEARVELHTQHLKSPEIVSTWSDITHDEKPPVNKQDCFTFPVGFNFDSRNIRVEQANGLLTFEVMTQDQEEDD